MRSADCKIGCKSILTVGGKKNLFTLTDIQLYILQYGTLQNINADKNLQFRLANFMTTPRWFHFILV